MFTNIEKINFLTHYKLCYNIKSNIIVVYIFMISELIVVTIIIIIIILFNNFIRKKHSNNKKKKKSTKHKSTNKEKLNNKQKKKSTKHKSTNKEKLNNKQKLIKQTDLLFLDISINNKFIGKIVIKLFDDIVPKTTHNFRTLCQDKKYVNTIFHRVIKDFMIQGGDYENFNGTGGTSIYGEKFPDENFDIKHNQPYLLSMANCGENTNGSQFFITTQPTPHLDGKHVVFGKVIEGQEIVNKLNLVKTNSSDKPIQDITITNCGDYYI
jgi:cyclophilin family peptidyl-prolyl cis-trans isomerase